MVSSAVLPELLDARIAVSVERVGIVAGGIARRENRRQHCAEQRKYEKYDNNFSFHYVSLPFQFGTKSYDSTLL